MTMKFEDLKLPDWSGPYQAVAIHTARAIYDQMRAHYESKPEPEELFEHPDMPGKKFRKLKVGEVIREGDWVASKGNPPGKGFVKTVCAGLFVESGDANNFYREVTEWRLPDPPAPVEYVPLDPEDVPPGSAVRYTGKMEWYEVLESGTHSVWAKDQGGFSWPYLAKHCEILRPGSKTWEPCKKIKP